MLEKTLSIAKAEQKVEDGDMLASPEAFGNRFSLHIAKIIHMHYENQKVQIIKILKTTHNPMLLNSRGLPLGVLY